MVILRDPERSLLTVGEQRKQAKALFAALHQLNVDAA